MVLLPTHVAAGAPHRRPRLLEARSDAPEPDANSSRPAHGSRPLAYAFRQSRFADLLQDGDDLEKVRGKRRANGRACLIGIEARPPAFQAQRAARRAWARPKPATVP